MTRIPKKPLAERILNADVLASTWLADGNEAAEAGNHAKAEACYEKAQFWKDRYTLLTNQASKAGPRR